MVQTFQITISRPEGKEVQVTVATPLPQEDEEEQTLTLYSGPCHPLAC